MRYAGVLLLISYIGKPVQCVKCQHDSIQNEEGVSWRYAREWEFPWMVSIQHAELSKLSHFCGGSIAAANMVLTACHCVVVHSPFGEEGKPYLTDPSSKVVVAGSLNNNRSDHNHFRVVVGISRFIAHPKCKHFNHQSMDDSDDRGGWDYDFGLVVLKKNLTLDGKRLAAFRLAAWDEFTLKRDLVRRMARHTECLTTGWGKRLVRFPNGTFVDLMDALAFWPQMTVIQVKLDDFASCYNILCGFDKVYCEADHWWRRQICATSDGSFEVCQGDSGGPLMCGSNHHLYGLIGWGPSCGRYKVPSVYATIYDGLSFIMHHLGKDKRTLNHHRISSEASLRSFPVYYDFVLCFLSVIICSKIQYFWK